MWARILNVAAGIWLMAAPAVLRYQGTLAADHDRVAGPVLARFACIAIWEITRPLRRVNTMIGAWLLAAPWVLGFPPAAAANSMAVGAVVVGLSLVRGKTTHDFAGGWTSVLPGLRMRDGAA